MPVYLKSENKKLVNSLESRGWCATELKGGFTSLSLGTYSLNLTKTLFCRVLALLSAFSVSAGSVGAVVCCRQLQHLSANMRSHQQRGNFLMNFLENFFLLCLQ